MLERIATRDLNFAAWLISSGAEMLATERQGRTVTFVFQGGAAAEQARSAWVNGTARGLICAYKAAQRRLLAIVHED